MKHSMLKAWVLGVDILLIAYGAWFIALQASTFSQALVLLLWASPALAAFVSAYLAPRKKIIMGTSMAIPATVLVGILNSVYQSLGHAVDFSGLQGGVILVTVMLGWNAVLSALGSVGGYFLAKKKKRGRRD